MCPAAPVESELVEQLLAAFKNKTPEKDLAVLLDTLIIRYFPELSNNREGMGAISHHCHLLHNTTGLVEKKVDILTQCVLQVGAKTISHSFNAFAK